MNPPTELFTPKEFALRIGVSTSTLRRWEREGLVTSLRNDIGERRYNLDMVEDFLHQKELQQINKVEHGKQMVATLLPDEIPDTSEPVTKNTQHDSPLVRTLVQRWHHIGMVMIGLSLLFTLTAYANMMKYARTSTSSPSGSMRGVQASTSTGTGLDMPAVLAESVFNTNRALAFDIPLIFQQDIDARGITIDGGSGKFFASNLLYGIKAGSGISISEGQTPTISSSGVLSFQGSTGNVNLSVGEGLHLDGLNINLDSSVSRLGQSIDTSEIVDGTIGSVDLNATNSSTSGYLLSSNGTGGFTWLSDTQFGLQGTGAAGYVTLWQDANTLSYDTDGFYWDSANNRLGIGTTNPSSPLSVGDGSPFRVDSSGNIIRLNNVTTSFPATQGGSNSLLQNDGSGNLSWTSQSGSGTIGYWQRNGTLLSPANTTDSIGIGTSAPNYSLEVIGNARISGGATIQNGLNLGADGITSAGAITGITALTVNNGGNITFSNFGAGILHTSAGGVVSSSTVNLADGDVSGILTSDKGGTGFGAYTQGDIIYAGATNSLSKLPIGGTDGLFLKVSGGIPAWGTITGGTGGSCTNCLIVDPGSTQTITPTAAGATGLVIAGANAGTADIFKVTNYGGTESYLTINNNGSITLGDDTLGVGVLTVAPPNTDFLIFSPVAQGAAQHSGTFTSLDLTANRVWTLPDLDGTFCLTAGNCTGTGAGLGGSGTTNYLSKWNAQYTLTNSLFYDNGANAGIGTTAPSATFELSHPADTVSSEHSQLKVNTGTLTIDTSYTDQRLAQFTAPNLSVNSGVTVNNAATLYVSGAPSNSGSGNLTNSYALWVDAGATQLDGSLNVVGSTVLGGSLDVSGNSIFSGTITQADGLYIATDEVRARDSGGLKLYNSAGASGLFVDNAGSVGIGTTNPSYKLDIVSANTTSLLNLTGNSLTTGTGINLTSTSTALSTGKLMSLDWSPSGSTEIFATSDLFKINTGTYANVGNLFALYDDGSELFSVDQSKITNNLPTEFTSAGDVSMAYDLVMTNQSSSNIKSYGPLTLDGGESWESNNLVLRTYNQGSVLVDYANADTTANNHTALQLSPAISGAISTGTRNIFGLYNNPMSTAANSGGTTNLYGSYILPSSTLATAGITNVYGSYIGGTATHAADAGTVNQYGLYIANGTSSTNGTSTKYGLYVEAPTGADTNFGLYSAGGNSYFGGNVGIGTTSPSTILELSGVGGANSSLKIGNSTSASYSTLNFTGTNQGYLYNFGSTYSTTGRYVADSMLLDAVNAGGLGLAASHSSGAIRLYTNGTNERMRIDSAGNVGIGTTSPNSLLHLKTAGVAAGTNNYALTLQQGNSTVDANVVIKFRNSSSDTEVYSSYIGSVRNSLNNGLGDLIFGTNGSNPLTDTISERMRITSAGNVGIGTTAPVGRFDVTDTSNTAASLNLTNNTATTIGAGVNTLGVVDWQSTSLTTGNFLNMEVNGLTTGKGINLSSTSTVLSTGNLASFDWSPSGSTEIFSTGDLFKINVGTYGNIGNLFALYDDGSELFSVDQSKITSALPHEFTAAGDVSMAYDLLFTNQSSANIKSSGPFMIEAGETPESNDLVLRTYNQGSVLIDYSDLGTTANTHTALQISPVVSGAISTGTRNIFGLYNNPMSTAVNTGGTTNLYGSYILPSSTLATAGITNVYGSYIGGTATHAADAGTVNQYGLYIANGISSTNGTSAKYGLYVEAPTGADTNVAGYFGGSVGIGTTSPGAMLHIYDGSIRLDGAAIGSGGIANYAGVEPYPRFTINNKGDFNWGPGSSAVDTNLYRSSANNLRTGDSLTIDGTMTVSGTGNSSIAGNVGIGTTSPASKLQISGATGTNLLGFTNGASRTLTLGSDDVTNGWWTFSTSDAFKFNIDNTDKVVIDQSGNVGIGTTAPGAVLEVKKDIASASSGQEILRLNSQISWGIPGSGPKLVFSSFSTGQSLASIRGYTFGTDMYGLGFETGNGTLSTKMVIDNAGNVGIGTTSPNSKLEIAQAVYANQTVFKVSLAGVDKFTVSDGGYLNAIGGIQTSGSLYVAGNYYGANSGDDIRFLNGSSVIIKNGGNVGIGTTSPGAKLELFKVISQGSIDDLLVLNAYIAPAANTGSSITFKGSSDSTVMGKLSSSWDNGGNGDAHLRFYTRSAGIVDERLRITSGGNVGIGTTAPTSPLYVYNTADTDTATIESAFTGTVKPQLLLKSSNNGYVALKIDRQINARSALVQYSEAGAIKWSAGLLANPSGTNNSYGIAYTANNPAILANANFVIDTSGNVGIGTTAPAQLLHISGASGTDGATAPTFRIDSTTNSQSWTLGSNIGIIDFRLPNDGSGPSATSRAQISAKIEDATGSNTGLAFSTSSGTGAPLNTLAERMRIDNTGNVGIGTTSPGAKLNVAGTSLLGGATTLTTAWSGYDPVGLGVLELNKGAVATADGTNTAQLLFTSNQSNLNSGVGGFQFVNSAIAGTEKRVAVVGGGTTDATNNGYLSFSVANTGVISRAMTILNSGNVGIGTTNPTNLLTLSKAGTNLGKQLLIEGTGQQSILLHTTDATAGQSEAGIVWQTPAGLALNTLAGVDGRVLSTSLAGEFIFNNRIGPIVFSADSAFARKDMYISTTGNVGIGTTAPNSRLSFGGATGNIISLYETDTQRYGFGVQSGILQIYSPTDTSRVGIGYGSSSSFTETLSVLSGNVGIGTTAPGYTLDVKSTGTDIARFTGTNSTGCTLSDGGVIACSSDRNLKKNILETQLGLDAVMSLRPVEFNWNSQTEGEKKYLGFIAQEVEQIAPSLVSTDSNGYKQLNSIGLIPLVAKAIQEQQEILNQVQDDTTQQQGQLAMINDQLSMTNDELTTKVTAWDAILTPLQAIVQDIQNMFLSLQTQLGLVQADVSSTKDQVASLSASLNSMNVDYTSWKEALASGSGVLGASNSALLDRVATVSSLLVQTKTTTFDLTVLNKLTSGVIEIGAGISGDEINSAGGIRFQTLSQGPIDFMNGKVVIDVDGSIQAKHYKIDTLDATSSTGGKETMPAGRSLTTVNTTGITADSMVFITIDGDYAPASRYWVTNQIEGESFTVRFDRPVTTPVEFSWFIIN